MSDKSKIITQAVKILKQGGLVAIPTETVYGLGADARNPDALKKIFQAKGRPQDHPLIIHLADAAQISDWAIEIPESAWMLAEAFWPGPLTLILKKASHVLDIITGGQDTVGLRVPNHPVALVLLKKFNSGIAAPSANRFGRISPTTATAVREELGDAVDLILEGGQCEVGVESTIIDLSGHYPVLLRPGKITAVEIEAVLGELVFAKQKNSPRVSGSHISHYAPVTPAELVSSENIISYLKNNNDFPIAILTRNKLLASQKNIHVVLMPLQSNHYAHDLYQTLRELDKNKFKKIIIEAVPEEREWDAVRDRLQRASSNPLSQSEIGK